jgi:hypothetical protein
MLKSDEIKYIEDEIKMTISSIEHTNFQFIMRYETSYEKEEHPWYTKDWLRWRIRCGDQGLTNYLNKSIHYPDSAINNRVQGNYKNWICYRC